MFMRIASFITNGIGLVTEPEIQLRAGRIKDDDIILMTTDGVHYAIQPQAMAEIILKAKIVRWLPIIL